MHYTGKLALRLPVPVQFDWRMVLLSLVVGIVGSAGALLVLSRHKLGWARAVVASIFLGGVGISGLHFTAMAAMRVPSMHYYYPPLVILSVVLGIVISLIAIMLAFLLRDAAPGHRWRIHGSAVLRGLANPVMHYTAMAGVIFTYSAVIPDLSHVVSISSLGILGISIVPVMVLIVALLISLVDRLQKQRTLLDELFEQAPQAVALMSEDYKIIRLNREFTQLFGYSPKEAIGRRLREIIVPDESQDEVQNFTDMLARGQRVEAEAVRQRKDGSRLYVSIVHVPVSLPGGQVARYAIYRDITERKRTEESLKLFRSLIDQSSDAIEVIDPNTLRFLDCNESAYQTLGYSREEFLSIGVRDIDPTIEQSRLTQINEEIEKSGFVTFESLHRRKDGSLFPVEINVQVVRLEKDYRLAVVRDITERKRAEETLRLSEERFAKAFHANPDPISIIRHSDSIILEINDRWESIFGYTRKEVIGRSAAELNLYVNPDDRLKLRDLFKEQGFLREQEAACLGKSGDVRHISMSAEQIVIKDEPCIIFLIHDITERKRAEEALRESEERYRELFDNAKDATYVHDLNGTYTSVNRAAEKLVGYTRAEILGKSFIDFVPPEQIEHIREQLFRKLVEERETSYESEVMTKDGRRIAVEVNSHLNFENGVAVAVQGTARDITERKAAEEKLKASSEQLRALSARLHSAREEEGTRIAREIHDELGAALTSLRWDLERFDKVISESADQSQLQVLRERIVAMLRLTETTISTVRRISSELRPSVLDDLGLAEAIEWQAQQFQARTGIICWCDCSLENLDLSREQSTAVFRILQEALTNVLRHAQATSVDITMKAGAGEFVLAIIDNGRGITENEKSGSQSLGLLGMQERAHLIGGKINVTGFEGKGTVITVRVTISG